MSAESVGLKPRTANLTGRAFGKLIVLSFEGYSPRARWLCLCECGKEKAISAYELTRGHIVSCGCRSQFKKDTRADEQPEFKCYVSMMDRCRNPKNNCYRRYGARGITVCARWLQGFKYFLEDVGRRPSPRHSLDRFPDNNGNYEPGNVRWAVPKEQSRNMRTNRLVTFQGETLPVVEWADRIGMKYRTLLARIRRGKSPEDAILTAVEARQFDRQKPV